MNLSGNFKIWNNADNKYNPTSTDNIFKSILLMTLSFPNFNIPKDKGANVKNAPNIINNNPLCCKYLGWSKKSVKMINVMPMAEMNVKIVSNLK